MKSASVLAIGLSLITATAKAHDTWVQTNTQLVRTGDGVFIDLMLGNHGNDHRDYKLAGKIGLEGLKLTVHGPAQQSHDLLSQLVDTGYALKEGFWTTRYRTSDPGLYLVEQTLNKIVTHGKPIRAVKSAKTFFVAATHLDKVPHEHPGFDRVLGHPLEIVPEANPVTPMGPDTPIRIKVLFHGQPLAKARVSFIPRGTTLSEGFDETYERRTNENGRCAFTPKEGNYYLVIVHHEAAEEQSEEYEATHYAATLTVLVPDLCPCCGE